MKKVRRKVVVGCRPNRINPFKCELRQAGVEIGWGLLYFLLFDYHFFPSLCRRQKLCAKKKKKRKKRWRQEWRKMARATWGLLMDRFQWLEKSCVISSCLIITRLAQMRVFLLAAALLSNLATRQFSRQHCDFFSWMRKNWPVVVTLDTLIDCILMATLCAFQQCNLLWRFVFCTADGDSDFWSLGAQIAWFSQLDFVFHFLQLAAFFSFHFISFWTCRHICALTVCLHSHFSFHFILFLVRVVFALCHSSLLTEWAQIFVLVLFAVYYWW